ncbi:MAG: alpha/beta fold hydrolase [Bacteroidota bacterium]|nr:alpha/beta fold hydrolase [Bacteroidota bacterium]
MELFSRIIGEGQPLVILHGLFGMSDNWQTFGKAMADEGYEVHLIDQRNHGQSPNSEEHTYQSMADDLLEYCHAHQLVDIYLLGHSMGGKVAMLFSCLHPQMVEKLVVVDIAPKGYPVHHQEIIDALRTLDFDSLKSRSEADEVLKRSIDNFGVRQFLLKSLYWKEKGKLGLRFNLDVIERNIEMVGESLFDDAQYGGPTLFIRGELSGYIKDGDMDRIHQHFPEAILVTIKGAGHWVHAEKPQEFLQAARDFLRA